MITVYVLLRALNVNTVLIRGIKWNLRDHDTEFVIIVRKVLKDIGCENSALHEVISVTDLIK